MTEQPRIHVIGVNDAGLAGISAEGCARLAAAKVVCGGHRHLAMLANDQRETIPIMSPLEDVYARVSASLERGLGVAVLASGDPCCFGIGPLLARRFGRERVEIIPSVSAMQLAFARVGEAWQEGRLVSAHGRTVEGVVGPVLSSRRAAILTDDVNTPAIVGAALRAGGLEDCRIVVCERLGGPAERIVETRLHALDAEPFDPLNVVLVLREPEAALLTPRFGRPEAEYAHRAGMITKAEVRAVSLSHLAVSPGDVVWDIGAGCGSVSLEAASLVHHGFVYAVERDMQQLAYLRENLARHTGPVRIVAGEAPAALADLPRPNAVFLGGSGGRLHEVLQAIMARLEPGGRLVANFVVLAHLLASQAQLRADGWETNVTQVSVSREVTLGRLEALNPVLVLRAARGTMA